MANSAKRSTSINHNGSRGNSQTIIWNKKTNRDVKDVFMTATEQGDTEEVCKLLENHGIQPDLTATRDVFGRSALSVAAAYGRTSVVAELLKSGANPMLKSASHRVALHEACIGGHLESAELLAGVADVNVGDKNSQTAAHLAAFNGERKVLKMLIEKGASMIAKDSTGRQPAHLAAIRNHIAILQLLCESGVDLDSQCKAGKTPLHYAAQHGGLQSVVCLVERDCDITIKDTRSYLPAHLAARNDKLDCLKFLIKYGTAIDAPQVEGRVCSHIAALYGAINVLHWLLETGANISLVDNFGNISAHYAAEGGNAECFNCCLHHDADLRIANVKGDLPLDTAKKHGHTLHMEKALRNEVVCPLCFNKFKKMEYDRIHAPAPVERSITTASLTAYSSPLPMIKQRPTQHQKNLLNTGLKKKALIRTLPSRDLAGKYFGEYLDPNRAFRFNAS